MAASQRIIVGISGASGSIYGVRLLQALKHLPDIETHLVLSSSGALTAMHELGMKRNEIEALADVAYNNREIGATLASGSFLTAGMVIAPCSMKTLAGIAVGLADNLIARGADVILKERRRLVLLTRETPLNLIHLRNMTTVTEAGAIVMPPVPAFYAKPQTLDDMINHTVARMLDLFNLPHDGLAKRWTGFGAHQANQPTE
jgi:2,5-furandicarboxylate decarboxylase 2